MTTDFTAVARLALAESPDFYEYPSHELTLQLCRAMARAEKRSINESLRACAAVLAAKTNDERLRKTLKGMAISRFPESEINVISRAVAKFVSQMERAMRLVEREKSRLHNIYPDNDAYLEAVAELSRERRKMAQGVAA